MTSPLPCEETRQAFCQVARGVKTYPAEVKELLDDNDYEKHPQKYTEVTTRQSQVVELVALGRSNQEIGYALDISVKTVEKHKRVIKEKYGCSVWRRLPTLPFVTASLKRRKAYVCERMRFE